MPEEVTEEQRLRLDAVDQAVLAEAAAERDLQLQLHKSDNERIVQLKQIDASAAADRRERRSAALIGLAIVVVLLAVIGAIWTGVDRAADKRIRLQQQKERTAQVCIQAGNIWINDSCLITRNDSAAPGGR
jgi:ABC-type uncharacterized transport system fused permease/ATPase subunit